MFLKLFLTQSDSEPTKLRWDILWATRGESIPSTVSIGSNTFLIFRFLREFFIILKRYSLSTIRSLFSQVTVENDIVHPYR